MLLAAAMTKFMGTLTSANLSWNNLGPEGAKALTPAIAGSGSLTELLLGQNNIGHEGAEALATALNDNSQSKLAASVSLGSSDQATSLEFRPPGYAPALPGGPAWTASLLVPAGTFKALSGGPPMPDPRAPARRAFDDPAVVALREELRAVAADPPAEAGDGA